MVLLPPGSFNGVALSAVKGFYVASDPLIPQKLICLPGLSNNLISFKCPISPTALMQIVKRGGLLRLEPFCCHGNRRQEGDVKLSHLFGPDLLAPLVASQACAFVWIPPRLVLSYRLAALLD